MKALYSGVVGFGVGFFFSSLGHAIDIDFGLAVPIGASLALVGLGHLAWGED